MPTKRPIFKLLCPQSFSPLKCPWARHLILTSSSCTLNSLWNILWKENSSRGINELSHCYYHHHTLPAQNETAEVCVLEDVFQLHSLLHHHVYYLISILICLCAIGQTANAPCGDTFWKAFCSSVSTLLNILYVAIDQAPVSACHTCTQTSVALSWPTVTDDHASRGWFRWWMNESARCVTFSLFQS